MSFLLFKRSTHQIQLSHVLYLHSESDLAILTIIDTSAQSIAFRSKERPTKCGKQMLKETQVDNPRSKKVF